MKRIIAVLLALMLVAALATGCEEKSAVLTAADAVEVVLTELGAKESDLSDIHSHIATVAGEPAYNISFKYEGEDYTYTIHAVTGKVLAITEGQPHSH